MFRQWLSGFWRDNKEKIMQIAKVFGVLIGVGVCAGMFFSSFNSNKTPNEEPKEVYKPKDVTISGGEISEQKFEKENLIVEEFVEFCNQQNSTDAYNLLTDECKEKLYPTLEDFENKYYKMIFTEKREYNIQAWISEKNYNTYRIRFTENFLETGSYGETENFEDYITIVTDGKDKKININGYIKTEEINKKNKTKNFEIEVFECDTYMNYVIYTLRVKNISNKDILLDSLDNYNGIKLVGTNGASYKLERANLKRIHLEIDKGQSSFVTLKFRKQYGSSTEGNEIEFSNVITDYEKYSEAKEKYEEFQKLSIKLK